MKRIFTIALCLMLMLSVLPIAVGAESTPVIRLSDATACQGDTVKISISITDNPGIMAMAFAVVYDKDTFEYVSYERGYLTSYGVYDHSDKGWVSFVGVENSSVSTNGTMLTLVFKVKENAKVGEYTFKMAHNNPEKYGYSLKDCFSTETEKMVLPVAYSGTVKIISSELIKGDVNGDGNVNGRDYGLVMQYINEWEVIINLDAADVNGDGTVNGRDYGLIMQYLNDWDINLN